MKRSVVLLAGLSLSVPGLAHEGHNHPAPGVQSPVQNDHGNEHDQGHEHEHEAEGGFAVESYLFTLLGVQPFGEACYLGVVSQGKTAEGLYFAEVETSFQHGGEGPGRLQVLFDVTKPNLLTAVNKDGGRISVALNDKGSSAVDAIRYAVTWAHADHFDNGLCSELKLVHDAQAEAEEDQDPVLPTLPPAAPTATPVANAPAAAL